MYIKTCRNQWFGFNHIHPGVTKFEQHFWIMHLLFYYFLLFIFLSLTGLVCKMLQKLFLLCFIIKLTPHWLEMTWIWTIHLILCHVFIIHLFHSIIIACNRTHTHLSLWSKSPLWPSSTHTLSCDLAGSLPLLPYPVSARACMCMCAPVTSLTNVRAGPHPQCVCECVSVASLTNVCPGPHPSHPSGPAHCFDV